MDIRVSVTSPPDASNPSCRISYDVTDVTVNRPTTDVTDVPGVCPLLQVDGAAKGYFSEVSDVDVSEGPDTADLSDELTS